MERLQIRGGNRLFGTVEISGSKNAALPIMAACLLSDDRVILEGVPRLTDVETLAGVLGGLGLISHRLPSGVLELAVADLERCEADAELVRRMRASFCVLGPLLARRGHARVALPGGCKIGDRPVDLHLKGLAALGATIQIEGDQVVARANRLRGAAIDLSGPRGSSVTATCNVMSAAVLAEGDSWIDGAAREPEIIDLGQFLIQLGARIDGLGTSRIHIRGVPRLTGTRYRVIPDRIEAATFMIAAGITRGELRLVQANRNHLTAIIAKLRMIGLTIESDNGALLIRCDRPFRATELRASPYPGLPTDVQAQFTALLATTPGTSRICDDVFPGRFQHVVELGRLGADIQQTANHVAITGVRRLEGATVTATDLRASAALVLAGLVAHGVTSVEQIHHLDRGYERLDLKLATLGAAIDRVADGIDRGRIAA